MKTTKLVVGIIMIILAVFIVFQSMVAGLGNAMSNNGEVSGSAGIIMAIIYLIAGIVYLATKKQKKLTADIINAIILALGWLLSIANAGSYSDLMIWGWLALIIGLVFLFWHWAINKKQNV